MNIVQNKMYRSFTLFLAYYYYYDKVLFNIKVKNIYVNVITFYSFYNFQF